MSGDAFEKRFEDCREEDCEAHRAIWSRIGKLEGKVDRINTTVERTRGAMLVMHGAITLLCSAAGVLLVKALFP